MIDIREPEEIEKAVERYGAKTILIERLLIRTYSALASNSADANVYKYEFDYQLQNYGSLDEFKKAVENFAEQITQQWVGKVIAVDFDDTIAKTVYPRIISPIPETIDFLRKAKAKGAEMILNTCREGKELKDALDWCKENNVPIDRANENSPERVKIWGNDCRKIGADLYIDDKACSLWHDRRDWTDLIASLFGVFDF